MSCNRKSILEALLRILEVLWDLYDECKDGAEPD